MADMKFYVGKRNDRGEISFELPILATYDPETETEEGILEEARERFGKKGNYVHTRPTSNK